MPYLYETHLHTCQGSACGTSTGGEHARFYKDLGFQGIIVTDHFFGGNTAVPADLPWKERIDRFCAGYEDALSEGQKIGLDVFFGWEQGYGDDEYLVYGLDKRWLLDHPEVENWTRKQQYDHIRRAGGCVIQAHPFRTRSYIRHVRLGLSFCDGIEVANASNIPFNDAFAMRYAKKYRLPVIAGSDNHHSRPELLAPGKLCCIAPDHRLADIQELVRLIRSRTPISLYVPQERFEADEASEIESFFLDEQEELISTHRPRLSDWA